MRLVCVATAAVLLGCAGPRTAPATDPSYVAPAPSARPPPPVGVAFADPVFGTSIVRMSNVSDRGGSESQEYSQLQAFSPDDRFVLLDDLGAFLVRAVSDLRPVALDTSSWSVPRWDPVRAHSVIHFGSTHDSVLRLQETDILNGRTRTLYRFHSPLVHLLRNQSWDELSGDGRWLAGMARSASGADFVFTFDLRRRRPGAIIGLSSFYQRRCSPDPIHGQLEPDWVGVSPLGRSLVVQWTRDGTAPCSGLETYDLRSGRFLGRPYDGHQHGDLGLTRDRREVFMTFELHHPSGHLYIGLRALPGPSRGASPPQYIRQIPWADGYGAHISCRGPAGACLVSMGVGRPAGWWAMEGELVIQYMDGSVRRLLQHRSSLCGYWAEPRGTWSGDGRLLVFASDWGRGSGDCSGHEQVDPYLVKLAPGRPPASSR